MVLPFKVLCVALLYVGILYEAVFVWHMILNKKLGTGASGFLPHKIVLMALLLTLYHLNIQVSWTLGGAYETFAFYFKIGSIRIAPE